MALLARSGLRSQFRFLAILQLVTLVGCSVLDPKILAEASDLDGEQPSEVEVLFSGNENLGSRTLRASIRPIMLNLSRGQDADVAAYDGADAIEEHYQSEGFPEAAVTWRVEGPTSRPDLPQLFEVYFSIVEGPQITISEVTIEGTTTDPDLLLPMWQRVQSGALGLGPPLYVSRDIYAFADAITSYYRQRGYLEIQVEEPEVRRDESAQTATVVLRVSEGRLFKFGTIELEPDLAAALGDQAPSLPEGEIFTTQKIREILLDIQSRLRRLGHPDPVVQIPPFAELVSPVIDMVIMGEAGPVARIAEIRIAGNEETNESFIRGKLPLGAGDQYDGLAVDRALANLYGTGLFRRVQINHLWINDSDVQLTVEVEETDSKSIELLAGYGSYEHLRAGVVFTERNLFGTGRQFLLDAKVSQRGYRARASISDPDLLSSGLTGTLEGEAFEREMPSFTDQAVGGTASLGHDLTPVLRGRFGYTYLPRTGARTSVIGPAGAFVDFTQGSLFLDFRLDDRDSVLSPTSGSTAFIATDWFDEAFGGDVNFSRLRLGGTHHVPLGKGYRVAMRADVSWLWPGKNSVEVPIQERFFNGGENTVRSFRQDHLGPMDLAGNPIGGQYRNLFSAELRIPIFRLLEGALFADAGNVGVFVEDYSLRDLSYALGAGVRVPLPIGPLRLDAGWNPDPQPDDRHWTVHFSIGYPF